MLNLRTSQKIFIASILSKFLIFALGDKKRKIKRNQIAYEIDLREGIDLGIFLNIKNEKKIFNITKLIKNEKKTILMDIGSNVGSVTLPLSKIFNRSKILTIEPTIYAYKKLIKNINLNSKLKKRIRAFNFFISNNRKKVEYVHSSWNFSKNTKKHKVHLGSLKKINNKSISLNKLIKNINKKIHFIKIDVDGYELDVLKSGIKFINKFKPIIHIEFAPYLHKEFGYTTNNLIRFIEKKINYNFFNEDFRKIKNVRNYVKSIINRSENFILINKNDHATNKKIKNISY